MKNLKSLKKLLNIKIKVFIEFWIFLLLKRIQIFNVKWKILNEFCQI